MMNAEWKINAFETQKVSFQISHYGWLFLKACALLNPNFKLLKSP